LITASDELELEAAELRLIDRAFAEALQPDPELRVWEWADAHRILSPQATSDPGKWETARTPYLREIMAELSPSSRARKIVFSAGAQIGKTETGCNFIGYVIDLAPGPMMEVQPTVDMGKRFSKQRIDPMIHDTPRLRAKVRDRRERDSSNTMLSKDFPNGLLVITGANSAVGLRSFSARYLHLDEVDAYPASADDEGDPVVLAQRAVRNFPRRKVYISSTPKIAGLSRVERELEGCDVFKRYHVPCPHCGHLQPLVFDRLRWEEGKPETVAYCCRACEALIREESKTEFLKDAVAGGRACWIVERDNGKRESVGFHLSALYSPVGWFSWREAVAMYEEAKEKQSHDLMRIFQNTVLGLGYVEEQDAPSWQRLYDRRETYPIGVVPPGALFLTAGVDVQHTRLEYEVVGWSRGAESWSIEYGVLDGDPARAEVWHELDRLLVRRDFHCAVGARPSSSAQLAFDAIAAPTAGSMSVRVIAVDSGDESQSVYSYVRQHPQPFWGPAGALVRQPRTVVATKGREHAVALVGSSTRADLAARRGLRVYLIGTWMAKRELYGFLRLDRPTDEALAAGALYPHGYVHVPQYSEEWFKQLTAERLVKRVHKGYPKLSWEKDAGRRNEALDCRVMARAAAELFGLSRFTDRHWLQLERLRVRRPDDDEPLPPAPPPSEPPPIGAPATPSGPATRSQAVSRSSWMGRR